MTWMKITLPIACAIISICFANEEKFFSEKDLSSREIQATTLRKIYVDLDQLLINERGIFLAFSETILPVNALFRDQSGFYILGTQLEQGYAAYQCPNGHPSPHGDGRCNQPSCPHFREK